MNYLKWLGILIFSLGLTTSCKSTSKSSDLHGGVLKRNKAPDNEHNLKYKSIKTDKYGKTTYKHITIDSRHLDSNISTTVEMTTNTPASQSYLDNLCIMLGHYSGKEHTTCIDHQIRNVKGWPTYEVAKPRVDENGEIQDVRIRKKRTNSKVWPVGILQITCR